ncbi:uncharacterized protein LOC112557338 [Pomacea canaliculata]|uniref:uncharacterized protein LOC112557338 n=1 Tax=Pomacea canaliculata TaxID=400727 RepID=UPI000D72A3F2|nr:uncharacterized protein LOC112557338 [Pomacea canaliculata]
MRRPSILMTHPVQQSWALRSMGLILMQSALSMTSGLLCTPFPGRLLHIPECFVASLCGRGSSSGFFCRKTSTIALPCCGTRAFTSEVETKRFLFFLPIKSAGCRDPFPDCRLEEEIARKLITAVCKAGACNWDQRLHPKHQPRHTYGYGEVHL